MEFVYEYKKHHGQGGSRGSEPDYPAMRCSFYRSALGQHTFRIRFAFNAAAIKDARWISGDQIAVGVDVSCGLICFKRHPQQGYKITGRGFSVKSERGKQEMPNFQMTTEESGHIATLLAGHEKEWIRLHESGVLMVTEPLKEELNAIKS
jgi:hypothetical protein